MTSVSNHVADGYIAVTGSLAAAGRAFHVTFGRYRLAGQGVVRAPAQAASAPASVAASVLSVSGLSTARATMRPQLATTAATTKLPPPGPNYWVAPPCGSYYGQSIAKAKPKAYGKNWPWAVCGYTPAQVRNAYGVTASGMTGAGQTVAVVDAYASPTMLKDANEFSKLEHEPQFAAGQYTQHLPASGFTQAGNNQCGAQGWYGEETLDVESVHDMAPAANVRFVAAASCQDPDLADALAYIVDNHVASIVSNSWGDVEDGATEFVSTYHLIFEVGAAEGIDFTFSSGDNGYEAPGEDPGFSDHVQVDYPTSDPFVTSVGGTSLAVNKSSGYQFETAWGTLLDPLASNGRHWKQTPPGGYPFWFDGGSGGGTSTQFAQPGYQAGVVPAVAVTDPAGRQEERRADAGGPGRVGLRRPGDRHARWARLCSSPAATDSSSRSAGSAARASRARRSRASRRTRSRPPAAWLGFANPLIYDLVQHDPGAYHDVTNTPAGPGHLAQVRANYVNPDKPGGARVYFLRTLGIDGEGLATLAATTGYDDATGVGSPAGYILAVQSVTHP